MQNSQSAYGGGGKDSSLPNSQSVYGGGGKDHGLPRQPATNISPSDRLATATHKGGSGKN